MEPSNEPLDLNADELALIRAVLSGRGTPVEASKASFTSKELSDLGFVRENWSYEEIAAKGLQQGGVLTSFDDNSARAERELTFDAPFATGITKWQLPIPLPGFRVIMTLFPPNTVVRPHVHPNVDGISSCGQVRVVVKGSITYANKKYGPGDWFYIPNDVPYAFTTDPDVETLENYFYQYNGLTGMPMRFSSLRAS